jgi:hypothetical protein
LTFIITGVTDPTTFETKIESLIESLSGITSGLIDVVVGKMDNNTFEIIVFYNGENPPPKISETVKGQQFSDDLLQQTGASIVPGSITEPNEPTPPAEMPLWGYIVIGVGLIIVIGIIIAVIFALKSANPEIV